GGSGRVRSGTFLDRAAGGAKRRPTTVRILCRARSWHKESERATLGSANDSRSPPLRHEPPKADGREGRYDGYYVSITMEPSHKAVFAAGLVDDLACVVTGGGTGIGFATARLLSELGARVALLGRRPAVVAGAARRLDPSGERVIATVCDIREPDD